MQCGWHARSKTYLIDPPFSTKQEFRGSQDQKAYQDKIAGAKFIEFLRKRLILMRELMASDGTIYVHLDQRRIHYIKAVMDELFGEQNFLCEIIWKSTSAHSDANRVGAIHQTILVYTRSPVWTWNTQYVPYASDYKEKYYRYKDPDGRLWKSTDLTGPGGRGPIYEWRGIVRAWRVTKENMEKYERDHRIFYTVNGIPRLKQYWMKLKVEADCRHKAFGMTKRFRRLLVGAVKEWAIQLKNQRDYSPES